MAGLYRKSSLEKLSSPEQLDKAIVVSSPLSWIVIVGVFGIIVAVIVWSIIGRVPVVVEATGIITAPENISSIYSDNSGELVAMHKTKGDNIQVGDVIATINIQNGVTADIVSRQSGVLTKLLAVEEDEVFPGMEIARVTPYTEKEQMLTCYMGLMDADKLDIGMEVLIYPVSSDTQNLGYMEAEIINIGEYAANISNMSYVIGYDNLLQEQFIENGPVVAISCEIASGEDGSGYLWSVDTEENISIKNGTFANVKIILEEYAPITRIIENN